MGDGSLRTNLRLKATLPQLFEGGPLKKCFCLSITWGPLIGDTLTPQSHPKEGIFIKVPNSAWHVVGAYSFPSSRGCVISDPERRSI